MYWYMLQFLSVGIPPIFYFSDNTKDWKHNAFCHYLILTFKPKQMYINVCTRKSLTPACGWTIKYLIRSEEAHYVVYCTQTYVCIDFLLIQATVSSNLFLRFICVVHCKKNSSIIQLYLTKKIQSSFVGQDLSQCGKKNTA